MGPHGSHASVTKLANLCFLSPSSCLVRSPRPLCGDLPYRRVCRPVVSLSESVLRPVRQRRHEQRGPHKMLHSYRSSVSMPAKSLAEGQCFPFRFCWSTARKLNLMLLSLDAEAACRLSRVRWCICAIMCPPCLPKLSPLRTYLSARIARVAPSSCCCS